MGRVIVVEKWIGYIGTTDFTTKDQFGLVFVGPWTDMDRSYAVRLQSINIWVGPGPVAVAVAPFRCQKLDLTRPENAICTKCVHMSLFKFGRYNVGQWFTKLLHRIIGLYT
jgi:hypothetical protein